MKGTIKRSAAAGVLLGAALVSADVIVDDFVDWVTINKLGGIWVADSDVWSTGFSTMVEPTGGQDIVKAFANIALTYDDLAHQVLADLKVTKDISTAAPWAWAGWVMDYRKIDTAGTGKQSYELEQWDRKNEVDISSCDALEINLQFTKGRQLWIEFFSPWIEKNKAGTPQYGYRHEATGDYGPVTLPLKGLVKPTVKYSSADAAPLAQALKTTNRIKILYEGQAGKVGATPAPYDSVTHRLVVGALTLKGATCTVTPTPGSSLQPIGIKKAGFAGRSLSMNLGQGQLRFDNLAGLGDVNVSVRSVTGQIVAKGVVNGVRSSLDVSGLDAGVYSVQASNGKVNLSLTATLLK